MSWYKAQYARQILIISVGKLMTQLQEIIQYIAQVKSVPFKLLWIECFHSRGQHLCKFIAAKESVCLRKEFNSHRIGLGHQHGRRDVMWKHSIRFKTYCFFKRFPVKMTKQPLFKRLLPMFFRNEHTFCSS